MMTRRRSTPSWAKIACWASPVRPAAQVWVEIGTPVAFCARAEARRMFSMTGVTPAVSVAHLMIAALTPVAPIPSWISGTKGPGPPHHEVGVAPEIDGGQVHDRPDAPGVEVGHLLLGQREDARAIPQVRPVLLHAGRAGDDVLVHERGPELGGGDRTERCLHRRRHGDLQPARSLLPPPRAGSARPRPRRCSSGRSRARGRRAAARADPGVRTTPGCG